jgi:peptide/nickel transport system permease protein
VLVKYKTTRLGLIIIGILLLVALLAPWLAPYCPDEQLLTARLQPMSMQHWFGTDELGRDIFSRVIYGSRYALYVVTLVTIMVVPLGLLFGVIAGYSGGWLDTVLMRVIDVFLAFPKLILALAFVAALGPGINNAILAIIITAWAPYARLARAQTLAITNSEFIWAIKMQGAGKLRILCKHIMPLCLNAIIVQASLDMSGFILSVAGLGFLGLGAQPPMPEWGAMIATGREYILEQWWLITFPGLAIAIVSVGFNLLGDGLRDIFDPRHAVHV